MEKQNKYIQIVLCFLPLAMYVYLLHKLYPGELVLHGDGPEYFFHIKYYLENILRGVYPLWNPFQVWGYPYSIYLRGIGEFNPFLFLIAFLSRAGIPFSLAYFIYQILYFLLGVAGFFCLSKKIFGRFSLAYFSSLALMFSTISFTFFNDNAIVLLFVPMVWFFYFLVSFSQEPNKRDFLGMTFAVMIIAITYIPFYFMTVFFTFLFTFLIFYADKIKPIFRQYAAFLRKHKGLFCFCLLSIGLALVPGIIWFISGGKGEFFIAWRHAESTSSHMASMSLKTITAGVVGPYTLHGLFSQLQNMRIGFVYIPLFTYLVIFLSGITRITRRATFLLGMGTFIFLISLADTTPVHRLLYHWIFIFHYFRNLQYFLWFSVPIFILFVTEQFRLLLDIQPKTKKAKAGMFVYAWVIHLAAGIFLYFQDDILLSAYAVIALSGIFFSAYFVGFLANRKQIIPFAIMLILICHSYDVFNFIGKNSEDFTIQYNRERKPYIFSMTRPIKTDLNFEEIVKDKRMIDTAHDTSGFVNKRMGAFKYVGVKWSGILHESIDKSILQNYVKHKFILYDSVQPFDGKNGFKLLAQAIKEKRNVAFVSDMAKQELEDLQKELSASKADRPPVFISENFNHFEVVNFNVNSVKVKTNFAAPKFLVYNDSYHSGWKAKVNGREAPIIRTNVAFKGIYLPPGENSISLSFGSSVRVCFNFVLLGYFFIFFVYLIVLYGKRKNENRTLS